jgi:hypothetical protein
MKKLSYIIFLIFPQLIIWCTDNMTLCEDKTHLEHFQNFGDTNSLLEFIKKSGRNEQNYKEAIINLSPIFESLSMGIQPPYKKLDQNALQRRSPEVGKIVKWMAESRKADMKTTAIELMGFLGWKTFNSYLKRSLSSEIKWERLAAIKALAQIPSKWAIELLRSIAKDPDPEIRKAVQQELKQNEKRKDKSK